MQWSIRVFGFPVFEIGSCEDEHLQILPGGSQNFERAGEEAEEEVKHPIGFRSQHERLD